MNKLILKSAICAIFMVITTMASAQNFYSYNNIIDGSTLRSGSNFDMERAKSLIKDLHPKIYLNNGNQLSASEANSYYADIDVSSFSMLRNHPNANSFEIIKIKVKNTDSIRIDLSQLRQNHTRLQYVFVVCDFKSDLSYIQNMFLNDDPNIMIIYSISIPM